MLFQFGEYVLNGDLYRLSKNGVAVDVEPQVFDLLMYLTMHRDRVVGRDELLGKLWQGRVVSDSALSGRLKAARKAVGDSGKRQSVIKTVHGRGYQFIADVAGSGASDSQNTGPPTSVASGPQLAPFVIVLPFKNMSGDPAQEYFSDGITEDIITELSRFHELRVMARNSSFFYKGHSMKVQDIGRELGVDYLVEGSVRRVADRVRVTVQMVDADGGTHIWGERYDRELDELFEVQDELTRSIVAVLPRRLEQVAMQRAFRDPTQSLSAYDNYLKGRWLFLQSGAEDQTAIQFLEKAIELDPRFAIAYSVLADLYSYRLYSLKPWQGDLESQARNYIERALALEENDSEIHVGAANVYLSCGEFDLARYHAGLAIKLNPNNTSALNMYGFVLTYLGEAEDGLRAMLEAEKMEVHMPGLSLEAMAETQYLLRDYEAAIETYRRWREPPLHTYVHLAACYAQLGRMDDAQRAVDEYNERRPDDSDLPRYVAQHERICKRREDAEHWLDGYRKAGLIE